MPPKKGKKVVGYQKAEPISPGFVVTDVRKVSYVTGEAVGQGGFGLIYLADVQVFVHLTISVLSSFDRVEKLTSTMRVT